MGIEHHFLKEEWQIWKNILSLANQLQGNLQWFQHFYHINHYINEVSDELFKDFVSFTWSPFFICPFEMGSQSA